MARGDKEWPEAAARVFWEQPGATACSAQVRPVALACEWSASVAHVVSVLGLTTPFGPYRTLSNDGPHIVKSLILNFSVSHILIIVVFAHK